MTPPHSRESLGIPPWFFCDGCSHSPDSLWLSPACDGHDWDYWKGEHGAKTREEADKDLRARIKHNAKYSPGSWLDRLWRPILGDAYYFAVTRFGGPSWRMRDNFTVSTYRDPETGEIRWEDLARVEGKHHETAANGILKLSTHTGSTPIKESLNG